ncbi:MAG: uroporphyrinogen-III C-methyltransferase [Planctomycetota bacterium]
MRLREGRAKARLTPDGIDAIAEPIHPARTTVTPPDPTMAERSDGKPKPGDGADAVRPASGTVCLVGAGPGDVGLLTIAGRDRLAEAQVVVYDALANPALLDLAPPDAQRIDVGKRAGHHKKTQDQINALLVEHAKAGKRVVRLKGGDPYVFGRGGEEAIDCAQYGVRCEVIPGVTAGVAAPATAGIPVTHRGISSSVTFVTAHEDPRQGETSLDYAALAALVRKGGTVCAYMGVGRLEAIADTLQDQGLKADTPVAVVQWGTLPNQRVARGTLANIADEVQRSGVGSPAIVVVGAVAGLAEPGLRFFDDPQNNPLRGQTVVVTRTRTQQSRLAERLRELGAEVLEAPAIRVAAPTDAEKLRQAVASVQSDSAERPTDLLLTSANAVDAFAEAMVDLELDARALHGLRIGVVGDVTAAALDATLRLRADVIPAKATGEALAERLIELGGMEGRRVLLPRADIASLVLPQMLREAGAVVTEAEAYRVLPAESLPDAVVDAFAAGRVDWVTFTSTSIASSLVSLLGPEAKAWLGSCRLASIGAVTSASMRGMGLTPAVEAPSASVLALAEAIADDVLGRDGSLPTSATPDSGPV